MPGAPSISSLLKRDVTDTTLLGMIAEEIDETSKLFKQKTGKPRLTLVPRKIITAIARVREYGNKKYLTPDSWKLNTREDYQDAAFRHFIAYLDDPDSLDEESGLPHLHHLATNIAFLIEGGFKDEEPAV